MVPLIESETPISDPSPVPTTVQVAPEPTLRPSEPTARRTCTGPAEAELPLFVTEDWDDATDEDETSHGPEPPTSSPPTGAMASRKSAKFRKS